MFKRRARAADEIGPPSSNRRRTDRQALGWAGTYKEASEGYTFSYLSDTDCVVHDLSVAGAGVLLGGDELSVGDRVVLDLRLREHERATIKVTGEVRHVTADVEGSVRAGVEFVGLGALERALLHRLLDEERTRARRAG